MTAFAVNNQKSVSSIQVGQVATFNYDRNYMTDERTRKHDGEKVTVIREPWEAQGKTYVTVENQFNWIYPVMIQELSFNQ